MKTVYIACDHTGEDVLRNVKEFIDDHFGDQINVVQTWTPVAGDDYPDVSKSVCDRLKDDADGLGILVCGSGLGVAMAANRFVHVRAGLCLESKAARMGRRHEDMNVLCLSAWWSPHYIVQAVVSTFLTETFEKGRHLRRIYKTTYLH